MVFRRLFHPRFLPNLRCYTDRVMDPYEEPFSKRGDNGSTTTLAGEQLPKDSKVFAAIGTTEELLSSIGLAWEFGREAEHPYIDKLKRIQTVIIDLTTAISRSGNLSNKLISPIYAKELEEWMREYAKELPPLERHIIPGGGFASASLHVARSVCRRAERLIVPLVREGRLDKEALTYLNRLADFLLIVSRVAAKTDKRTESIYIPKPEEPVTA